MNRGAFEYPEEYDRREKIVKNTLDYPDWVPLARSNESPLIDPKGFYPPIGICVEFKLIGNESLIVRGHTVSVTSFKLRNNGRTETMFVANNRQLFESGTDVVAWRQIPDEPIP